MLTLIVVPVAYSLTESMLGSRPLRWFFTRVFGSVAAAAEPASEEPEQKTG